MTVTNRKHFGAGKPTVAALMLVGILSSSFAAQALTTGQPDFDWGRALLSTMLIHAVPTQPLEKGSLDLQVSPAYLTNRFSDVKADDWIHHESQVNVSGEGLAIDFVYGFSRHLGVTALAAVETTHGTSGALADINPVTNRLNALYNGNATQRGFVFSPALVVDPFGNSKTFHLPMIAGPSYNYLSDSSIAVAPVQGQTLRSTITGHLSHLGFLLGIAPQFDIGPMKLVLFEVISEATPGVQISRTLEDANTGSLISNTQETLPRNIVALGGIGATYRPWNLSATVIPPISSRSWGAPQAYALSWEKRWGGSKP